MRTFLILPCLWLTYASAIFALTGSAAHSIGPGLLPALLFSLVFWFVQALSARKAEQVFWIAHCWIIGILIVLVSTTFSPSFNAWRNGVQTIKDGYRTDFGQFASVLDGLFFVVSNFIGFKIWSIFCSNKPSG
jgi:amino acid transporter